jgi:hypothetical protein
MSSFGIFSMSLKKFDVECEVSLEKQDSKSFSAWPQTISPFVDLGIPLKVKTDYVLFTITVMDMMMDTNKKILSRTTKMSWEFGLFVK